MIDWQRVHTLGISPRIDINSAPVKHFLVPGILWHANGVSTQLVAKKRSYAVLDVGGSPHNDFSWLLNNEYARQRKSVELPELAMHVLDLAPARHEEKNVHYIVGTAEKIPLKAGTIHSVVASALFEYLDDREKALAEIRRVLAQEGHAFFVFHAAQSPVADEIDASVNATEKAALAIRDSSLHPDDERLRHLAAAAIEKSQFNSDRFVTPEQWLARYNRNDSFRQTVDRLVEGDAFDLSRQIAAHLRKSRLASLDDAKKFIIEGGFEILRAEPVNDSRLKFWCVEARKKSA